MIRRNQKHFNRLHFVVDALIIITSYVLAWCIKFNRDISSEIGNLGFKKYMVGLILIVPSYLVLYFIFNLYKPKRLQTLVMEFFAVIKANTVGLTIFIIGLYIFHEDNFSREMMFIFYVINIFAEEGTRFILRRLLRAIRNNGFNLKHVVLVGYSRAAEGYIDRIKTNPYWGYRIVGILDDNVPVDTRYRGEPVIGKVSELQKVLDENDLDEIVITLGLNEYGKLEGIVNECEKAGVHTKFIPDYNNIIPTKPYTEDLLGLPVVHIRHVPLSGGFNKFIKRFLDFIGSLFLIILFSPIMLVVAILVKTTSKGPLIYKQERVGLHNKPFMMYKFRSMAAGSDEHKFTTADDTRVTGIGKFIRKTSLDELPQLFNVLVGDMSLVGPRPERTYFVEQFKETIPRYMVKHQVRPGMTGWAQINGYRGDTSINKRIEYDLYYIENWSLGFDIIILFQTIFKGFINKNAY